jgi:EAL and modified HD-GYP domain-containing signal transduction protein
MNPPGQAAAAAKPSPCLARQPILTQDENVLGYELLFRESSEESHFTADVESATCNTIDTLNVMGLDVVCDGRLAFINCTRQMLLKEYFFLLPPEKAVAEIQENVPADASVMAACQQLKQKSYRIALDNFALGDAREALVPHADFIKIDIRRFPPERAAATVARYASKQRQMLAQRVETRLQFLTAMRDGFTVFQGYFFRHPERMRARSLPANQATYLRLLQVISAPALNLAAVEDLIKHDPSLCYRLLRYLNSPLIGLSAQVQSVRHGMTLLGERELVRWIRMATTLAMGQDKCSDLVLASLVRAQFCEVIASKADHGKSDLFLIGMLSLMDAILEMPMGVVVEGLALDADAKATLLGAKSGQKTPLSPFYDLMVAREAGDWEGVTAQAKTLNLSLPFVNRAYTEAIAWAHQMTTALPRQQQ